MKKRKLFLVFMFTFIFTLFGVTSSYILNKNAPSESFSSVGNIKDELNVSHNGTSQKAETLVNTFNNIFFEKYLKPISLENIKEGDFVVFYSKNSNGLKIAEKAFVYNGDNTISTLSNSDYRENIEFSPLTADKELVSCFRFNHEELVNNIEEFLTLIKGDTI